MLIVGASTRSAAHSARRAGLRPVCVDAFGDIDLATVAEVVSVCDFPRGIIEAADRVPECPWMYTGALENHLQIVAALSERRLLWGNGPDEIQAVRDPWRIQTLLERSGLPNLRVWGQGVGWTSVHPGGGLGWTEVHPAPPIQSGTWVLKPLRGSAGRGVVRWEPGAEHHPTLREPHYFQQYSGGLPISALFLGLPGRARLIGVTRQLIGLAAANACPNIWCGNIAPWLLTREETSTIEQVGNIVAESCELQGLFGGDFLLEDGVPRLTEVNPRYTGSVELVEHLLQVPLLDWHRRACTRFGSESETNDFASGLDNEITAVVDKSAVVNGCAELFAGKIVLYAGTEFIADDMTRFALRSVSFELPYLADIPGPGARFSRGQPVCTLFATARTMGDCLAKLERRAINCRIAVAAACL